MEFLIWVKDLPVTKAMAGSLYGYPILLCVHAIGMGIVVGLIWMTALRALGYARGVPLLSLSQAFNIAWFGFAINAISGLWIFTLDGPNYVKNWSFLLKMFFILLGGITVWVQWHLLAEERETGEDGGAASTKVKVISVVSALFWLGAIVAGRNIAYTL